MQTKNKITPNNDLYGDFTDDLIPLNLDAVQQRIDFFEKKVRETLYSKEQLGFYKYHKAWIFWKNIKEEHCLKETK